MKHRRRSGYTIIELLTIFWMVFLLYVFIAWIGNFVRLVNCDWQAPYKDEAIYGIAAVTFFPSAVTVWMDLTPETSE